MTVEFRNMDSETPSYGFYISFNTFFIIVINKLGMNTYFVPQFLAVQGHFLFHLFCQ